MKSSEKITVEEEEIINDDAENAEIFNTIFSNAVKNLKILEYQETNSLANNISHVMFKAILKYRNHRNIVAIKNLNKCSRFDSCIVGVQDVVKEIETKHTKSYSIYKSSCQKSKRKLREFWKLYL